MLGKCSLSEQHKYYYFFYSITLMQNHSRNVYFEDVFFSKDIYTVHFNLSHFHLIKSKEQEQHKDGSIIHQICMLSLK